MPLSEHEQRLLEQMERALYAEDPTFANNLRTTRIGRSSHGKAVLGIIGVLIGMGVVVAGVATDLAALGVVGFVIMLVSAAGTYAAYRTPKAVSASEASDASSASARQPKAGFMDRVEERWRRLNQG